jgi:thiamine biosynthesis lipoprotein
MKGSKTLSRRRFLKIMAASSAAALPHSFCYASERGLSPLYSREWRGTVMGAEASLRFNVEREEDAKHLEHLCLTEIQRLEEIFSLHRAGSSLRTLNRQGFLQDPEPELVELLRESIRFGDLSRGRFDVSIQPLWKYLYYQDGEPDVHRVEELKKLIDYRAISVAADRVCFAEKGMEVTLNGIAQGFITDKIATLLRAAGQQSVLVELGETYALGRNLYGEPWQIGIRKPLRKNDGEVFAAVSLENKAIATSGGYGMPLASPGQNHILDPNTGQSPTFFQSVSVISPRATWADGLSTALYLMPREEHARLTNSFPETFTVINPVG